MHKLGYFCALLLLFCQSNVYAQAVWAEVKIEIPQAVSLERQAFLAKLGIDNAIDTD